jgi:hypothetical protein
MADPDGGEPLTLAIRLLKRTLDEDRDPLAPRLDPRKAILAKLEPPKPASHGRNVRLHHAFNRHETEP